MLTLMTAGAAGKFTARMLENFGFVNVPKGTWVLKTSTTGGSYKAGDDTIPLTFNDAASNVRSDVSPQNVTYTNTSYLNGNNATVYVSCKVSGTGQTPRGMTGQGNYIFAPPYYGMDLTKTKAGLGTRTDVGAWFEKVR